MGKLNNEVQDMGGVAQPQVANYEIESFDDDIRSARKGKKLSENVQAVFDKMKAAIEYAKTNTGKAQISFPHSDYPLKGKLVNANIANAITSGKKKFNDIVFSVVVDAVNRDGVALNTSVLRVSVKPTEAPTEATVEAPTEA
jgi:hypothetical protein